MKKEMKRLHSLALCIALLSFILPLNAQASCTLLGATGKATADGNAYIASTSDNPWIEGPRKPVYVTIPQNGFKFVHTPCLILQADGSFLDVGSDRGMNEKGFSWTRSWVVPKEAEAANKMSGVDWFIKLGSTVATVDEAIAFVKNNPKGIGCQGNYIFADAQGNLAIVEVSYSTVTVAGKWNKNDAGYGARANRWETQSMIPLDDSARGNPVYYNSSPYRYPKAMALLKAASGTIDVAGMKTLISFRDPKDADPTAPHENAISNHGREGGTVSAEVYDPAHKTFWYTYGWPDGDMSTFDKKVYGFNENAWGAGAWIPFILDQLTEQGWYTDWEGRITPMGSRYVAKLIKEGSASRVK